MTMSLDDLRRDEMMKHLIEAQEQGKDIGHYGRLTFAMVGRYFMDKDELVAFMLKGGDADEAKVRAMVQQVEDRGYSPPRRQRLLEWQSKQDFPIIPDTDDPDAGNVYRDLDFPDSLYEHIEGYRTGKYNAEHEEHAERHAEAHR